ncbi:hypothetical protein E2C01_091069 [Portunus trituberculatus]|uniref:Uncharacterized protein n=1 Tax=Portunus trituberculatus TaxID=210409 RepID=A0A5B7JD13_PORTR|nr:hypothetical protein [Portunus trituberculatus]
MSIPRVACGVPPSNYGKRRWEVASLVCRPPVSLTMKSGVPAYRAPIF